MVRLSNTLVGFLNLITFLLSIPIIIIGIFLLKQATTECERFLDKPMIVIGVFLLLVSFAGMVGSCCRVKWLMLVYLFVMFALILVLFCYTIFTFAITSKGAGANLTDKAYKEYRLRDYSQWLQNRVKGRYWGNFKSFLIDSQLCNSMLKSKIPAQQFYKLRLSSVESGCCKPSNACNFQYVSPSNWSGNTTSDNKDCGLWSNDPGTLCYGCSSCKAGMLDIIKSGWKKTANYNIILLVFLIIVYTAGFHAYRNIKEDNSYP